MFKTAAVRSSIHFERDGKDETRLDLEACGNESPASAARRPTFDP